MNRAAVIIILQCCLYDTLNTVLTAMLTSRLVSSNSSQNLPQSTIIIRLVRPWRGVVISTTVAHP